MRETEEARVECLVPKGLGDGAHVGVAGGSPVERIAEDGMPGLGQVNANLMRASGLQSTRHVGRLARRERLHDGHLRDGSLPLSHLGREANAVGGMAPMLRIEGPRLHVTRAKRRVLSVDRVLLKLRLELFASLRRARDDHHAARPLVEAVYDAGAQMPLRITQVIGILRIERPHGEKAVHERPSLVAACRMHNEPRGLHYDEKRVIDVEYIEWHAPLRLRGRAWWRARLHDDLRPFAQLVRRLPHRPVDSDTPTFDPPLKLGAGRCPLELRERGDQKPIQSNPHGCARNEAPCPSCGVFTSSVHQRTLQRVRDVPFDGPVVVVWDKKRWRCWEIACSRRSFTEATAQVPARARFTTRLGVAVLSAVTTEVRAVDRVARQYGLSWPTVGRLLAAAAKELAAGPVGLTRALGIDEHRFRSVRWFKDDEGAWRRVEPWSVLFTDLDTGAVLGVVDGRDGAAVRGWLRSRPRWWRHRVQVVAIDPSAAFRAAVHPLLPNAKTSDGVVARLDHVGTSRRR